MTYNKDDNWVRQFLVSDPSQHHKGFTLYKITSLVYPRKYPEAVTTIVIWKRYNDFKKLHKELKHYYKGLHLEDEFPPFVKARFFRRFHSEVVEERRQAALKLLEFIADHPSLFTSNIFIKFSERGYSVEDKDNDISSNVLTGSRSGNDTGQAFPQESSDDDRTSFTTDTDSAISSPPQGPDLSLEEDSWSCPSQQLQPALSQTTLSSLASVESLLQSFKNRFIGSSEANEARRRELEVSKYWTEAQKVIASAEGREREQDYQAAFDLYKAAISQLLNGVQNDTDRDRQKRVKEKTADYLNKAEFIANNFLSRDNVITNKKEGDLVPLSKLWQPLSYLQWFKVVGVMGKVMLVIDTRNNYLFIIKALYKSAYPIQKNKPCIFPRRIPYLVELNLIFETDSTVFLVLQYVSGGKVWDYVSHLFHKSEETPLRVLRNKNPYRGRHYIESDLLSVTSDSCPSDLHLAVQDCEIRSAVSSPGNSYLDLIRDYASSKQLDNDMQSQRNEDCEQRSSPELKIVCGDSTEQDDPQGEVVSLPTFTTSHDHLHRDDDKVLIITDSNCQNRCSPEPNFVDNKDPMTATSDLYKDVLTLVNSDFTLNIEDTTDIDTKDLVEHAQRLLQSVDATLLESDKVISRVGGLTRLAVEYDSDMVSVASGRSLDAKRLQPQISSKGSSPLSSIGPDAALQCGQIDVEGAGISEDMVRRWAAQLLTCIHSLHQMGIVCLDLNPDNLLLSGSNIRVTYFYSFPGVEPQLSTKARELLYTAPELSSIFPVTCAADWWSLGTLLYHLLTGQSLSSYYPSGILCHTILHVPDTISVEARSLLKELLRYDPSERLGSGLLGVEEIKSHPFFEGVQWDQIYSDGLLPV